LSPLSTPVDISRGGNFARGTYISPSLQGYDSTIQVPIYASASAGGYGQLTAAEATARPTLYYDPDTLAESAAAVRKAFEHSPAFQSAWWDAHPQAWRPPGWKVMDFWVEASWDDLKTCLGIKTEPIYFDYGNTIVYQGDQVIAGVDGPVLATAAQYYQQASDLARSDRPGTDTADGWTSLGIYALVLGEATQPTSVFQLAISKGGAVRGNAFHPVAGTTSLLRGAVDAQAQRVAWTASDNTAPVLDTGLVNLTKDCAPVLIHFAKDRTQQWLLVRIQKTTPRPVVVAKADSAPAPAANQEPATVVLSVPEDAEVWIDGVPTSQRGYERRFVTPPLDKGERYHYTIRAAWSADGKGFEESRTVPLQAGRQVRVSIPGSDVPQ
jgi:uncharacterized protein (TIGR03000 family)